MKILFLSTMDFAPWGGSEALWSQCAQYALKKKHNVTVCVKHWGTKESSNIVLVKDLGAKIIYRDEPEVNIIRPTWHDIIRFRLRKHLGIIITPKKIQTEPLSLQEKLGLDYDVVCVSQGAAYDMVLKNDIFIYLNSLKAPFVSLTQFNYDYGFSLNETIIKKARIVFEKAKLNLFVAKSNLNSVEHQIAKPLNNCEVINNPLNLSDTSYIEYPDDKTIVFACVARLHCKTKAIDVLISVLGSSNWMNRDWILNIYGKGEDEFFLRELIKKHNLENKVFIKGHVKNIDAIWETSNILILPSIFEGTPISLHEAMLKGRACITTHVAGITEYVINDVNGFISPSPNYFYLSKTLEKAWSKKRDWSTMGLSARGSLLKQIDLTPEKTLLEYLLITSSQSQNE